MTDERIIEELADAERERIIVERDTALRKWEQTVAERDELARRLEQAERERREVNLLWEGCQRAADMMRADLAEAREALRAAEAFYNFEPEWDEGGWTQECMDEHNRLEEAMLAGFATLRAAEGDET